MEIRLATPGNLDRVTAALQSVTQQLGSPRGLLKAFGITVRREIDLIFREGGRPQWKPLAPWTLAGKRQGKRKGSFAILPLQSLRTQFVTRVEDRAVTVTQTNPVALFQHFGTRGPYPIRPKNAKALALPNPEGGGAFSLAGLGRSRRRPTGGGFTFKAAAGQRVPGRFAGRQGKAVQPRKSIVFFAGVMHPGLVPRPIFPTDAQIIPRLEAAAEAFLALLARKVEGA